MTEPLHMMMNESLLHRFLSGACTKEEMDQVLTYLEQCPGVLERYLDKDMDTAPVAVPETRRPEAAAMLLLVHDQIAARGRKRNALRSGAVLFLVASFFIGFWNFSREASAPAPAMALQTAPRMLEHINYTGEPERILLPDQTTVVLYSNSVLRYRAAFEGRERNLILEGEADFDVAKDSSKPFIVVANKIATRALGTRFKIHATDTAVLVKLFEGKVMIWQENSGAPRKYYLTPNHQLQYTAAINRFTTSAFGTLKPVANTVPVIAKKTTVKPPPMAFRNLPLETVLEKMATRYNIQIEYSAADIGGIYIIADDPGAGSAEYFLQNIAHMNQLQLVKKSETVFAITR
ncbi:FecR family protein [Niabella pedocola]|uniref:FecR family protein n=1 Tax=Niabella pedocola TaxID=1752077 RepID=A0ABS8PY58_9BACT|nr:FecR family protein [Niabella pedocola]MCD2425815.1 FecR family protein [Niabella pedocola]